MHMINPPFSESENKPALLRLGTFCLSGRSFDLHPNNLWFSLHPMEWQEDCTIHLRHPAAAVIRTSVVTLQRNAQEVHASQDGGCSQSRSSPVAL
jgi:hypothetical protein